MKEKEKQHSQQHHHRHHHHHHHHHHGTGGKLQSISKVFVFCIVLNVVYILVEATVGFAQQSLGLLSDAGHNLGDVFTLALALLAYRLSKIPGNTTYTYGYKKGSILIALTNALILLVAVGAIAIEAIHKVKHPSPINGLAVSWTAGVGIVVNGLTALLLMQRRKQDVNVRAAFLHMLADTLVSVGVLASGIVIYLTGWTLADPIISLVVAAVILVSTADLLHESLRLSLDGVPKDINRDFVVTAFRTNDNVKSFHHLHIWAISTTENALTAHVVVKDIGLLEQTKQQLKHALQKLDIQHVTLEAELPDAHCHDKECGSEEKLD